MVWKHSAPGRLGAGLRLAWEHSLLRAWLGWTREVVAASLLLGLVWRWLHPAGWQHSFLATGLTGAGQRLARIRAETAGVLAAYREHALVWRGLAGLIPCARHAYSWRWAGVLFPVLHGASWRGWLLAGFALSFPFLPTSVNLVAVWVILLAVHLGMPTPVGGRLSSTGTMLAVFAAALVWATLGSVAPGPSITALTLWATYLALYATARQAGQEGANAQVVVLALLAGGAVLSTIALGQWLMGIETSAAWVDPRLQKDISTRAFSVFDNPNILAGHLAFLVPLALLAVTAYRGLVVRLFSLACLGLVGAGLLVTLSRGALLAVFLSIGLVAVLRDRRYLVVLVLLAVLFTVLAPPVITDRLWAAFTFEDSSARYRTTIWLSSWRLLQDYWVTGTGLGPASFAAVYPLYKIAGTPAAHTHNLYLQLVVELGIGGAVAFILFMLAWAWRLLRARCQSQGWLLVALLAAIGGAALHGLVENIWYSPKSLMLFWLLLGLGSGLADQEPVVGTNP